MAIVRTAKGTAPDKSAGLTVTVSSFQLQPGDLLLAGISYDVGSGSPVIKWGQRIVKPVVTVSGNNVVTRIASMIYNAGTARTRSLVATWTTTAPTAKAMIATAFTPDVAFGIKDVTAFQSQAATGSPNSGTAVLINYVDEVLWGIFGSEGPSSDAIGTVQNGWTSGQRVGTAGAPPVSNITCHEIYKIVTAAESAQASKTGATVRNFSTAMATFRISQVYGPGGGYPSDYSRVVEIFENAGLDTTDMCITPNLELDRLEAWDMSGPTLVAYYSLVVGGWAVI